MKHSIIYTVEQFVSATANWSGAVAADTETALDVHLLGLSLAAEVTSPSGPHAVYIPFCHFDLDALVFRPIIQDDLKLLLTNWLLRQQLVGHNFTYDKHFIQKELNNATNWVADTRLLYHLSSAPAGPRPYGLKDAQVEILGWAERGDSSLAAVVEANGGRLKDGEHYKADLDSLALYAAKDAYSTILIYKKLMPWVNQNDYSGVLSTMMDYNLLLDKNTRSGILVNIEGLQKAHDMLTKKRDAAEKRFRKELKQEIMYVEQAWSDRKASSYKREYNKVRYLAHPEEWKRFNLNSDKDKRELFFDVMGMPVADLTDAGLPSTSADNVKQALPDAEKYTEALNAYLTYEKANTLVSSFAKPYLDSVRNGRLHPGFNICGTVSYRLSGFKPYLLNAPFDEKYIMRHLHVDPGHVGVHADLSAIEPTITAHFSEDASLLKVFRDGLGDIYLDLALELFPNNKELHSGYNPYVPITKQVKERFARERKIAKVIQLAVQYTGTKYTVARNLSKDGIPTTEAQADSYVRAYWRKFSKVAEWNLQLKELNRREGHLRNVIGRIIRVPDIDYKDLSNRFIQSSGHDVLILWVLQIYRLAHDRNIPVSPILLDCHDSTSNQCPKEYVERLEQVYIDALKAVNDTLGLCVTVKMEMKRFTTLAGLKGEE